MNDSPDGPDHLSGGAASAEDLARTREVLQVADNELTSVRSAAAKWQAGLSGATGGLTLFAIAKSRSDIAGLKPPWGVIGAVLLGLAVIASVTGVIAALRASSGLPKVVFSRKFDPPASDHAAAVKASRGVRNAVFALIVSLVLFGAALAVVWFAPTRSGPVLRVVPRAGTPACGSVESIDRTQIAIKTSDGVQRFSFASLRAMQPVATC